MNPFRYKDWTNNDLYQHWVSHPLDNQHHLHDSEDIPMTYDEWIKAGIDNGWCGPAVCYTHDGLPMSDREADEFEDDICIHIIRLYEDDDTRTAVERDHAPSQWRKPRD